ncbi:MAG: hypothetical protein ACLP7Q_26150 [Isosphaeraceae bacterium]
MSGDSGAKDLREKILEYARKHKGQKVGGGSCWDLAEKALDDARAKGSNDYGRVTPTTDYIWGEPIDLGDAQPGDILQFKNHLAKVVKRIKTKILFPNKEFVEYEITQTHDYTRGHHTAIVDENLGNGAIRVWEQHVKRGRAVVEEADDVGTIYVSNSRSEEKTTERIQITPAWGEKVKAYFPQKTDKAYIDKIVRTYKNGTYIAGVQTTNEISVTGTINAYKAEPRR